MLFKRKKTPYKKPIGGFVVPVNRFSVPERSGKNAMLTFMSYNVQNCASGERIAEIVNDIRAYAPDVVCVQEIDYRSSRSGKKDILKELADILQMNSCFYPAIPLQGGVYGVGILSAFPLENCILYPLEVRKGDEARILARAEITVGERKIRIYNTHLSFEDQQMRLKQMKTVYAEINKSIPFVLMGDFNVDSLQEFSVFSGAHAVNTEKTPYQTFIGEEDAFRAIDNIIISEDLALQKGMLGKTTASDHLPLIAAVRV